VTDLSHDTGEDGFHEIQLSGKQLVFLFMATTVVSVVIFLCGVLVGRGVKGDTVNAADPVAAGSQPPATAQEGGGLSYARRLEEEKPVKEELKPTGEKPAAPDPKPAAGPPSVPAPVAAPAPGPTSTARPGTWAVQVVALTDRSAATAVVQRLTGKGYPAFLVNPQAGAPVQNYKVQVGRYSDRAEAEQIKTRLKKEEQFEPWILR
jgi:cell division septation protein DedD